MVNFLRCVRNKLSGNISDFHCFLHNFLFLSYVDDDIQIPNGLDFSDYFEHNNGFGILTLVLDYFANISKREYLIPYLKGKGIQVPAE
jgi:hypothetical protein